MRMLILVVALASALAVAAGAEAGSQAFKPRKCGADHRPQGRERLHVRHQGLPGAACVHDGAADDDPVHPERDDPAPLVLPLRAFARRVGRDVRAHREERADHPRVPRRRLTRRASPGEVADARRAGRALHRRVRGLRPAVRRHRRADAPLHGRRLRPRPRRLARRRSPTASPSASATSASEATTPGSAASASSRPLGGGESPRRSCARSTTRRAREACAASGSR